MYFFALRNKYQIHASFKLVFSHFLPSKQLGSELKDNCHQKIDIKVIFKM